MRALKIGIILAVLLSFGVDSLAQIQFGTPWTNRSYTSERLSSENQVFLRQADIHYRKGDLEATFLALQLAVESDPQSPDALLRSARFKELIGMKTEAAQEVRLANQLNPYAADLYGYNGPNSILRVISNSPENALQELRFDERVLYYYRAVDLEALKNKANNLELELVDEVLVEIEENRLEEAMSLIYSLISLYPKSAIAYDLKGVVLFKQGQLDAAESALLKAVKLQEDFAIAWYNLSLVKREKGRLNEAKTLLDKALELQSDLSKAYFDRALVKKSLGDKEGALADYNKVIELRGEEYLSAFLNRGLTRKMLGDYTGALADLNKVIEEQPRNALLYKNRGNLHLLFANYNAAIDDYTRAVMHDRNLAEAYYNRGLARILAYDTVEACSDLDRSALLGYERAKEKQKYFCIH